MKLISTALATSAAVAAVFAVTHAMAASPRDGRLGGLLAQIMSSTQASGGVMVVADGSRVWQRTVGVSDRRSHTPMRLDNRFRIASATKMLVATVVLQLVGERKLQLDEPVGSLLPGRLVGGELVTVRDLLNHTSGIYDSGPLYQAPGAFHYDNANYVLLGEIVRAVTGTSVRQAIERRVLRPLGLSTTLWPSTSVPLRLARGYTPAGRDVTSLPARELSAADALVSTAPDLRRFLGAMLGGRLFPGAVLPDLETAISVGWAYRLVDQRYGLGVMGFRSPCGPIWGHRGRIAGYTTFVFGSPDGRRSIVVLLNVGRISDASVARVNPLVFAALCA